MPTPAEALLALSPLTGPATPAAHLLAIELSGGDGTPYQEQVTAVVADAETLSGSVEQTTLLEGAVSSLIALVGVIDDAESVQEALEAEDVIIGHLTCVDT